jgi:hypothetical protein
MPRLIFGPSTAADWAATCFDDTFGCGTWPRSVLASFAVATSSQLTVGAEAKRRDDDLSGPCWHALYLVAMRKHSIRPMVERLPYIAIRDIAKLIPHHNPHAVYQLDSFGLRYPGKVMLSTHSIKVTDAGIIPQCFRLAWIKTGMGKQRPLIVCQCRRNAQILYFHQGRYACRRCHRAEYQSQHLSKARNRLWQAARLRIELNGLPSDYKLPPRPKGQRRKTYLRLTDRISQLELQARNARKREIDTSLYAYHL